MEVVDARDAALRGLFADGALLASDAAPLDQALATHRGALESQQGWLLRRLWVTASAAPDLLGLLDEADDLEVAVHCDRRAGTTFTDGVAADIATCGRLAADPRMRVTAIHARLPDRDGELEAEALLDAMTATSWPHALLLALELSLAGRSAGTVLRVLKSLQVLRDGLPTGVRVAATLTCGPEPGAVPSDLELAGFMLACADAGLPICVMGGLDHLTRTGADPAGDGAPHGILNVLAAASVAAAGGTLAGIERVLAAPAGGVRLGSGALVVGDDVIEAERLRRARTSFLLSVGTTRLADVVTELAVAGTLTPTGALA